MRGKLVLILMLLVGAGAAAFALWFRYQHGHRTIELWGSEAVLRVRDAEVVELLRLEPAEDAASETVQIGGQSHHVVQAKDISDAAGLLHLRHALIQDGSYVWDEPIDAEPRWEYALRFSRDGDQAVFAFDLAQRRVTLAGHERVAALSPHLSGGLQTFFDEAFAGGEQRESP